MPYLHLATGSALLPPLLPDGPLLLAAPDERFAELAASDTDDLRPVLAGLVSVPVDGVLAEIARGIVDWGAGRLAAHPVVSVSRAERRPPPNADPLAGLRLLVAERLGATMLAQPVLDERALLAFAVGPVLPVHRELGVLVVGPLLHDDGHGHPGDGIAPLSWADVRFRRLAASPARVQLARLWTVWSAEGDRYCVSPSAAVWATASARATRWVADHAPMLRRHQLVVPLDGGDLSMHPVLPVPTGLLGVGAPLAAAAEAPTGATA